MPPASSSAKKTVDLDPSAELTDADWLKTLQFRKSALPDLVRSAENGDCAAFSAAISTAFTKRWRIGKRERLRTLASLATLWRSSPEQQQNVLDSGSLVHCLFDQDLNNDEFSGRVETILAAASGRPSDFPTLVAAHWMLRMASQRFEPETLLNFYRWNWTSTHSLLTECERNQPDNCRPESSCDAFQFLELRTLNCLCYTDLKGSGKTWRHQISAWREAIDATCDTDGTPHSRWLNQIFERLCQVAAVTLFAETCEVSLWDRSSHKLLAGLFARSALLVTPAHSFFQRIDTPSVSGCLLTAAEILQLAEKPGLLSLLSAWEEQSVTPRVPSTAAPVTRTIPRGKFPKESQQSDWAEWGCLRSAWSSPVDECVVRHHGAVPEIGVTVADHLLFSGNWRHELKLDGQPISAEGDWSCCCWYSDRQATFIELQLEPKSSIQIIRQALLLRNESVLMLADSIRLTKPARVEFSRHLPLGEGWSWEDDAQTRERALLHKHCRVRLFPWSAPQQRIVRSDESTVIEPSGISLHVNTQGRGLFAATLFDWSPQRREDGVEWQRLTVAEDGQIQTLDTAVGYRLRLGKKQWLVYHSLKKPAIPRSVLGVHTLSESLFGAVRSNGDTDLLVEVEL